MSAVFEELDRRSTEMGELSLRRRLEPELLVEIFEVQLGGEFLMSSLFTVAEIALASIALNEVDTTEMELDVVVGGLGLGYTARAVLEDPRVRSLHVVEALAEVIDWHRQQLLPLPEPLLVDPRCHLVRGDFFALLADGSPFGPDAPTRCHAVLVDIDHTPRHVLHPSHASFYEAGGLQRVAGRLHPGGVFALWSDAAPDREFIGVVESVFASCEAHVVSFPNPYSRREAANTVYVARNR